MSCTNNDSKETEIESNLDSNELTSFDQLLAEIPAYDFPVRMSCNFDSPAVGMNFDKFHQFFPEGGRVVSKLNSQLDIPLIIFDFACDYSCPNLYSFDKKGTRLDSLSLTPGQCGEDPFMNSRQWFLISEDMTIELRDTTHYFDYNDVEGTRTLDSITVETHEYILNNKGTFELENEKIEAISQ